MAIDTMDKLISAYGSSQDICITRTHEVSNATTAINTSDPVDGWAESTSTGWKGGPRIGDTTVIGSGSTINVQGGPSPTNGFPVFQFNNAGGSNKLYLASVQTWSSTQNAVASNPYPTAGTLLIFDRIATYRNVGTQAFGAGSFKVPASPDARWYSGGVGVRVAHESLTTTLGSTATVIGYTNSDGTVGRVSPSRAITAGTNRYNFSELPLQAGDRGVREINSVTSGGGANACLTLYRPIARVPVSCNGQIYDFSQLGMPEIPANCGLSCAWVGNTGSVGPTWGAILKLVEG